MGPNPRPYAEALEAWQTSCPRFPVWEDANDRGLRHAEVQPSDCAKPKRSWSFASAPRSARHSVDFRSSGSSARAASTRTSGSDACTEPGVFARRDAPGGRRRTAPRSSPGRSCSRRCVSFPGRRRSKAGTWQVGFGHTLCGQTLGVYRRGSGRGSTCASRSCPGSELSGSIRPASAGSASYEVVGLRLCRFSVLGPEKLTGAV